MERYPYSCGVLVFMFDEKMGNCFVKKTTRQYPMRIVIALVSYIIVAISLSSRPRFSSLRFVSHLCVSSIISSIVSSLISFSISPPAPPDATVCYIAINRIFDAICPIANIILAIIAAIIASMLTHNIAIITAAIIIADALPAIAYGAAAAQQAMAFENALNARLDTIIATL